MRAASVFDPLLAEGFGRSGVDDKAGTFETAVSVFVSLDDDLARARRAAKPMISLYVGGMGARGRNFYNDLARRYGYEEEAEHIQDLYLGSLAMLGLVVVARSGRRVIRPVAEQAFQHLLLLPVQCAFQFGDMQVIRADAGYCRNVRLQLLQQFLQAEL